MRFAQLTLSSGVAFAALTLAAAAHAQTVPAPDGGPPPFNWTGPYVGINAGYVVKNGTIFDRTAGAFPNNTSALQLGLRPTADAVNTNGFTGGAQIGYNVQLSDRFGPSAFGLGGGLVVGLEADAAYTDIRRTDTLSNTTFYGPLDTPGTTPTTRVNQYQGELRYLGTVRGRVGLAYRTALIYGTGGVAYGDVLRHVTYYGPNATTTPYFAGSSDGIQAGYVYGGGVELAVPTHSFLNRFNVFHASGATVKLEYIHYDLGDSYAVYPGVNGGAGLGGYTSRVRTDGDIVRAGLNYKF